MAQLSPILGNPVDCSLSSSSVHGIFQARVLEWVAISFSIHHSAAAAAAKSLQLCPTLRALIDCSLPGSSVHGIFQARVPEQGAIAPQAEWLKKQKFIFSQFWRLEVRDQGISRFGFF